ncbi:MAG: hypothetical protein KGN01_06230 [Patescibacteria group bacterium]|nr:hypothetical protein [Patescibacteria group bacterium]
MRSQIGLKLGAVILLVGTVFCFGQTTKRDPVVPTPPSAPKAIQTDQQFRVNLDELVLEQSEITRISHLSGNGLSIPVSISDLYQLVQTHNAFLQKWVTDHKIPKGWIYHAENGTFIPPSSQSVENKPSVPGSKK